MRRVHSTSLALAALSVTSVAMPALAGSPYYDAPEAARTVDPGLRPSVQRRAGYFTCSYNERRTKLERKNCGGARY